MNVNGTNNVVKGKRGFQKKEVLYAIAQKDEAEKQEVKQQCKVLGLTDEQLSTMSFQEQIAFILQPLNVYKVVTEHLQNPAKMSTDTAGRIFIAGMNKVTPDLSAVKSQSVDGKRITINWND